jgi:hypothetical protein
MSGDQVTGHHLIPAIRVAANPARTLLTALYSAADAESARNVELAAKGLATGSQPRDQRRRMCL